MPLVCGVDSSTQSTKALVVDADTGEVVAEGRAPHAVRSEGGASETDPEVWWGALRAALQGTGRAGEVEAISVAAQQHGLVACDDDGRPLRPAVLWNDTRSAPDAAELLRRRPPEWWATEVGSVPAPSFTATTWAWLGRAEPEIARSTRRVRLPHDWLTERLCGRGVTDRGDASGTGWWSTPAGAYHEEVLDLLGLDPELLPAVIGPREAAGEVTSEAAEALALRPGIPVGAGTGDNMGAALGLAVGPGTPVMSLGTSGTVYVVADEPSADPTGVVAGFADATGRFLPLACTLNCTLAVDRMAEWLGVDRETTAEGGDVVVVPFFEGERTPNMPEATGMLTGLRAGTTSGQILRATYEGVVVSLLDALDRLDADPREAIVLVGGGAKGRVWRETVRRLSGRPILVPRTREAGALGAAAQAAAVLGGEAPDDVATRWATDRGELIEAEPVDEEALERHRRVRAELLR